MFTLPENLAELSLEELAGLRTQADAIRIEIASIEDDEALLERLGEFDEAVAAIETIDARIAEVQAADAQRAEQLARVRAAKDEPADEADETDPADGEDDTDGDGDAEDENEEVDAEAEERVPVTASAARRGTAARAASRAPKPAPAPEAEPKGGAVALVAAANVPEFNSGQELENFRQVATAFQNRSRGWARSLTAEEAKIAGTSNEVRKLSKNATQHNVARIDKTGLADLSEFSVTSRMSTTEQFDIIMQAANEKRLGKGGLIASGGWCAPSETIYGNFLSLETVSGILDIPTVNADRGGINFTKGPDYASIAATFGFLQTEAQAIAGTEKTCYPVACPPFSEVRLDAIGFCITAGILTEAAYPELIDRVLQIGTVAHAHKVNASVISRILGYVGAAVDHVEMGSATADILDAVELQTMRLRYTYSMDPEATVEAFFPVWAIALFRSDLARRSGVDMLAITRADVERWFATRGVSAQWVYDWQNLTTANTTPAAGAAWTSLPDTLEFVMYPAGAFVKLATNVISLDTIYDSVNTSTNTFTAAFFEEGIAVANTGATGIRVSVTVTDLYGRTGAHALAAA